MPEVKLSMTARDRIVKPYLDNGTPHEFRTTPVSVSGQLKGTVVDAEAASGFAFLKFSPQVVKLARKGIGDSLLIGRLETDATEAETNLQRGGSTDGARDMAIEGLQISPMGLLLNYYTDGNITGFGAGLAPADADVVAALNGKAHICDPFGVVTPPQLQSPYLLEEAVFTSLMKLCTAELKLDTSRPFNLGSCTNYPGAAGTSALRANGLPEVRNQFIFEEGILWQRDGEADSDLTLVIELHRPLIVPISLVTLPGGAIATAPVEVYQRIGVNVLGVSVSELAVN